MAVLQALQPLLNRFSLSFDDGGIYTTLATSIALLAGLWYTFSFLTTWYGLRHVPGVPLSSFTRAWFLKVLYSGRTLEKLVEQSEKLGPIFRVGPNQVMTSDAETLWHINAARTQYVRSAWSSAFALDPYDDSLLSELDSAKHDAMRARVGGGYHGRGGVDLEGSVDSQVKVLVDIIRNRYAKTSKLLNLSDLIKFYAVDVITTAGLGKTWGDMTDEEDKNDYLYIMDTVTRYLQWISYMPTMRSVLFSKPVLAVIGPKPTQKWGLGQYLGVVRKEVDRVLGDSEETASKSGSIVHEWIKNGLTRRELEVEISLQLPAGSDTSSQSMRGILTNLLGTPRAYSRLKAEIAQGIKSGKISDPITSDEAKQLPYLNAVINEGIRIWTPIGIGSGKVVPAGGDTVCGGVFLPAGTEVLASYWGLLHDKSVFGQDSAVFRPERFLEGTPEHQARLIRQVDLAFSHGRWGCLGKVLAYTEMQKFFVAVMRNFDFQLADVTRPCVFWTGATVRIHDLWVRVEEGKVDA